MRFNYRQCIARTAFFSKVTIEFLLTDGSNTQDNAVIDRCAFEARTSLSWIALFRIATSRFRLVLS